jgi:transcription termination/antitermination protein NusG
LTVSEAGWFALWTHSHCEQLVRDQLTTKGFDAFLPTIRDWSRRGGKRHLVSRPMFPGYLFVHHAIEKLSYIEIMKTNGLVRILGERWDKLAAVADEEIDSIRRLVSSDLSIMPYPYLREGQRVQIIDGPLSGVEGILVRTRPNRGLLVLSVELLHRSIAVEIACTDVIPVEGLSTPRRHASNGSTIAATVSR